MSDENSPEKYLQRFVLTQRARDYRTGTVVWSEEAYFVETLDDVFEHVKSYCDTAHAIRVTRLTHRESGNPTAVDVTDRVYDMLHRDFTELMMATRGDTPIPPYAEPWFPEEERLLAEADASAPL